MQVMSVLHTWLTMRLRAGVYNNFQSWMFRLRGQTRFTPGDQFASIDTMASKPDFNPPTPGVWRFAAAIAGIPGARERTRPHTHQGAAGSSFITTPLRKEIAFVRPSPGDRIVSSCSIEST